MTIDGLTASLTLLAFGTLVGVVVWLIKGRLDKGDADLQSLKGHVVYDDTCQARRETIATSNRQQTVALADIKAQNDSHAAILNGVATDVEVLKSNSLKSKEA